MIFNIYKRKIRLPLIHYESIMFQENLWIDKKYADEMSGYLLRYKKVKDSPYKSNFRCDICGDSEKNKFKTRGYIVEKGGKLLYYCHNCGASMPFYYYLKTHHFHLYSNMILEKIQASNEDDKPTKKVEPAPVVIEEKTLKDDPLSILWSIDDLPADHYARQYVENRLIPEQWKKKLYFCPAFYKWINMYLPGKFSEAALKHDGTRLIIPFFDKNKNLTGVTGRSFESNDIGRYIVILFDETKPKLFGLDTLNYSEKVYIIEGPIDSMFIENSIGLNGVDGDLSSFVEKNKDVIVLDNQPRNQQVINKYAKYIADGYSIVIWPDHQHEKDINDLILAGKSADEVKRIIDENTFQGPLAEMKYQLWRKL